MTEDGPSTWALVRTNECDCCGSSSARIAAFSSRELLEQFRDKAEALPPEHGRVVSHHVEEVPFSEWWLQW